MEHHRAIAQIGRTTAAALAVGIGLMGCDTEPDVQVTRTVIAAEPLDRPLDNLEATWMARFVAGDGLFDLPYRDADGLGPLYIRSSCSSCHRDGLRGPGAVTKLAPLDPSQDPAELLPFGPTLRPLLAGGATTALDKLPVGTHSNSRLGPAVVGLGWLEAIDGAAIEAVAAAQAATDGPVHGLVARVPWRSASSPNPPFHEHKQGDKGLIGRFGYKARIATVDEFVADALQGDMGLTSPLRPNELANPDQLSDDHKPGVDVTTETVHAMADYVRLLAIPTRQPPPKAGEALFAGVGCATCHVPGLPTRSDYPVAALAGQTAKLYTDVLLHDMGEALDDGLQDGHTTPMVTSRHWRTAPLVALARATTYLHDGRAKTLQEAIDWHNRPGSEAQTSAQSMANLSAAQQQLLLQFLLTL